LQNNPNFKLIKGDIRDTALLDSLFAENHFRTVLHLAARAGVRPSIEDPLLYQDVNVRGTLNLLEVCRRNAVEKMVFASSSSVYGASCPAPFREDANINHPISPYAASKASAELFCRTYNHLYRMPVIVLRLFTVYGPRQRPDLAIHRFTQQIDRGEPVNIYGDGTSRRDYTYIDDIVDGFIAAMDYGATGYGSEPFQTFNLGGGRPVDLNFLLITLQKALNRNARVKYAEPVPGDMSATGADISKAQALLGYHPKFTIEAGIASFVRWYLNNKENGCESPGRYEYVSNP
jgi:UDP-glucuronate 4-epimerase